MNQSHGQLWIWQGVRSQQQRRSQALAEPKTRSIRQGPGSGRWVARPRETACRLQVALQHMVRPRPGGQRPRPGTSLAAWLREQPLPAPVGSPQDQHPALAARAARVPGAPPKGTSIQESVQSQWVALPHLHLMWGAIRPLKPRPRWGSQISLGQSKTGQIGSSAEGWCALPSTKPRASATREPLTCSSGPWSSGPVTPSRPRSESPTGNPSTQHEVDVSCLQVPAEEMSVPIFPSPPRPSCPT